MKSETPSRNPVEAVLAQAAIDNATSLTPDFQTEITYRLRMVVSALDHLALIFSHAEANDDALEPGPLWGVARLISNEAKIISDLQEALHETLNAELKCREVRS